VQVQELVPQQERVQVRGLPQEQVREQRLLERLRHRSQVQR
jgi:hypothetical protein